jgi:hypothetical protein
MDKIPYPAKQRKRSGIAGERAGELQRNQQRNAGSGHSAGEEGVHGAHIASFIADDAAPKPRTNCSSQRHRMGLRAAHRIMGIKRQSVIAREPVDRSCRARRAAEGRRAESCRLDSSIRRPAFLSYQWLRCHAESGRVPKTRG